MKKVLGAGLACLGGIAVIFGALLLAVGASPNTALTGYTDMGSGPTLMGCLLAAIGLLMLLGGVVMAVVWGQPRE